MPLESRLAASRLRLLSHPSLETAPNTVLPKEDGFEPSLLVRLLTQLDERDKRSLQGLNPVALADRELLGKISRAASLSDEQWCATISKGCANTDVTNRETLKAIAQPPLATQCFAPGTQLVDDAMANALKTEKAFEAARKKLREALRRFEIAEAARKQEKQFPKEWSNHGPRAGNAFAKSSTVQKTKKSDGSSTKRKIRTSPRKAGARCCFCPDDDVFPISSDSEDSDESELLGPFVNSRGQAKLFVHFNCACWAPQVFADPRTSQFRGVYDEYRRGRQLRCSGCRGKGATVGCYIEKCQKVFHYRCLKGARAKKVTQFFAAFCKSHAHLAEKDTYKLMMRAHTIADVATARRESTDGLDAPHSKFTKLRRRDTEIIFSRSARICSHTGVYEHGKTLFSSARRAVVGNNERLRIDDRVRLVRYSAIAVASGYLALLAAGRNQNDPDNDVTATEARAAIASQHSTPLFLLRNFEGAPNWTTDEITIAKPVRRRSVHFNQRMRKYAKRLLPGANQLNESNEENNRSNRKRRAEDNAVDYESPRTRSGQTKARRLNNGRSSSSGRESAPLPTLKNYRLSGTRFLKASGPVQSENEDDVSDAAPSPPPSRPKKRSGWDVFLDEQLPRERAVRPEDDMDVALSNMARMWSLLSPAERTGYENRAIAATNSHATEIPDAAETSLGDVPRRTRPENRAAGLFSVKTCSVGMTRSTAPGMSKTTRESKVQKSKSSESTKGRASVAIPSSLRRRWCAVKEEPSRNIDVNWDDMFPIDLTRAQPSAVDSGQGPAQGSGDDSSTRVAPPPRKR